MDLIQLGKNISTIRRAKKLTQEDIAFELDISINAYSRIERGETNVSFNRLLQIADFLKVPIAEFIQEKESPDELRQIAADISQIKKDIRLIQQQLTI